jgi:hypothetical protein
MTSKTGIERVDTLLACKALALMPEMSAAERRVGAAIVDHFNRDDGRCDPSVGRLAEMLGLSHRTVLRAIYRHDRLGLILKDRHGGRFQRNSYEPQWSRFKEIEADWRARMRNPTAAPSATSLRARSRQKSHLADDRPVTQTCSSNLLKEPVREGPAFEPTAARRGGDDAGPAGKEKRLGFKPSLPRMNRIPSQSASDAWRQSATRRWNNDLHDRYGNDPEAFGTIIGAIDDLLSAAVTVAEMRRTGAGLPFLLDQLRRREPTARLLGSPSPTGPTAPRRKTPEVDPEELT